jgi:hypothetical protein
MFLRSRVFILLVAGGAFLAMAGSSDAQMRGGGGFGGGGLGGGGFGGGLGGWWTGIPYGFIQSPEQLPYFSKYPPVYYSHPVARTYGYSPFAYPPGYMTPDLQAAAPENTINPFVPQPATPQETPKPSDTSMANAPRRTPPKMIVNPYVDAGALISSSR